MSDITVRTIGEGSVPTPFEELDPDEYRKTVLDSVEEANLSAVPQYATEEVPDVAGADVLAFPEPATEVEVESLSSLVSFEKPEPFIRFLDMPLSIEQATELYVGLGAALDEASGSLV